MNGDRQTIIKDISRATYLKKMAEYGFVGDPFGYWRLPLPGRHVYICDLNGGERYRDKLAYMLRQLDRHERKIGRPTAVTP